MRIDHDGALGARALIDNLRRRIGTTTLVVIPVLVPGIDHSAVLVQIPVTSTVLVTGMTFVTSTGMRFSPWVGATPEPATALPEGPDQTRLLQAKPHPGRGRLPLLLHDLRQRNVWPHPDLAQQSPRVTSATQSVDPGDDRYSGGQREHHRINQIP